MDTRDVTDANMINSMIHAVEHRVIAEENIYEEIGGSTESHVFTLGFVYGVNRMVAELTETVSALLSKGGTLL